MAGRLLPIALATVSGVAIGIATFDGELRQQRKFRLEEEYKKDLKARSGLESSEAQRGTSNTAEASSLDNLPSQKTSSKPSTLSSVLGLWAWKTREDTTNPKVPVKKTAEDASQSRS